MRIPSGVTDQYIYFVAVDATDFTTRETGLSSFTVYRSRNGGAAAAMTTPTINETDATNMPGVYELLVDEDTTLDTGDDVQEMVFHITHAGMAPVTRTIEIYRPDTTLGCTLDVTVTGGAGIDWSNVENKTATVALTGTTVQNVNTVQGNVTGNVTGSIGALATQAKADVNAEVDTALTDIGLDHLLAASVTGTDVTDNSILARLVSASATADWDDFVNTTDSLQAIRDRGDAAWTTGAGGTPPNLLQSTTIATLATQTGFTLTAGSADDDAYNGCVAVVTDSATSTQKCIGYILDYVGSSKTITLKADPGVFTMAVGDTIDIIAGAHAVLANSAVHGGAGAVLVADHILLSSTTDHALQASTTGAGKHGIYGSAAGVGGYGMAVEGNNSTGIGLYAFGELHGQVNANTSGSTGNGLRIVANGTGAGMYVSNGGASGDGLQIVSSNGDPLHADIITQLNADLTEVGGDGDHLTAINLPDQTMNITGNLSGSVGSVTGNINTAAGTIQTLDALDTAQDTQHSTTQSAITTVDTVVDAILVDTAEIGAAGAGLTEAGGTGDQFSAEILSQVIAGLDTAITTPTAGSVWEVLNDLSGLLPATTIAAQGDAMDIEAIGGDTTALAKFLASLLGTVTGAVVADGGNTADTFKTDLGSTSDYINARVLFFYNGALAGQAGIITDYDGTTKFVTVETGSFTTTPSDGDDFAIN